MGFPGRLYLAEKSLVFATCSQPALKLLSSNLNWVFDSPASMAISHPSYILCSASPGSKAFASSTRAGPAARSWLFRFENLHDLSKQAIGNLQIPEAQMRPVPGDTGVEYRLRLVLKAFLLPREGLHNAGAKDRAQK